MDFLQILKTLLISSKKGPPNMARKKDIFLLERYYNNGYLDKKYYINNSYYQPFSALDRLKAGIFFYQDFLSWKKGHLKSLDLSTPKVDTSYKTFNDNISSERFRKSLRKLSTQFVSVIYKIVIEQSEIKSPYKMSKRETLYFNDEIKTLLCRGLDELVSYYKEKKNGPQK